MLHLYHDVPQCKHCGSYKTAYSVPNTKNPFQNVMKHLRKGEYIYEDEDGIFNCLCLNCGMQWKTEIPSKIIDNQKLREQKILREIEIDDSYYDNLIHQQNKTTKKEKHLKKEEKKKRITNIGFKISKTFLGF